MKSRTLLALAAVSAMAFAALPAPAPSSRMPSFGWARPSARGGRRGKSDHRRRLDAWLVERNRKR